MSNQTTGLNIVSATPDEIIGWALTGVITTDEANAALDKKQIRGGFSPNHYTGFDYKNQVWVKKELH